MQEAAPAKVVVLGSTELCAGTEHLIEAMNIRDHGATNGHTSAKSKTVSATPPHICQARHEPVRTKDNVRRVAGHVGRSRLNRAEDDPNPWMVSKGSGKPLEPVAWHDAIVVGDRDNGCCGHRDAKISGSARAWNGGVYIPDPLVHQERSHGSFGLVGRTLIDDDKLKVPFLIGLDGLN